MQGIEIDLDNETDYFGHVLIDFDFGDNIIACC